MGYSLRYYAAHKGQVYRLPASKIAKDEPVLPGLAGIVIKYVSVAVENRNRITQKVIKIFAEQRLVLEDGSIDFSLQDEDLQQMDAFLSGRPVIPRAIPLWNREESQALINLMKEDLGDSVVSSIPNSYFMGLGIQPPASPFRVIENKKAKRRNKKMGNRPRPYLVRR